MGPEDHIVDHSFVHQETDFDKARNRGHHSKDGHFDELGLKKKNIATHKKSTIFANKAWHRGQFKLPLKQNIITATLTPTNI